MSELEIWNEIGNIYYNTGAYDEAIRTYQKVIELNPGSGQSYCNLATIFVCQGRYAEAIPLFQKGIDLLDEAINKAFLWNQLGDAYRRLEDCDHASTSYRKAIELDPDDATFQENLAEVELVSRIFASESATETKQENHSSAELDVPDDMEVSSPEVDAADTIEPELVQAADKNETETAPGTPPAPPDTTGSSEPGNACWVFQEGEPNPQADEKSPNVVEPTPVILGSRLLSDAAAVEVAPEKPVPSDEVTAPDQAAAEVTTEASSPDIKDSDTPALTDETSLTEPTEADESAKAVARGLLRLGIMHWRKKEYERAVQFLKNALEVANRSHDLFLEALCYDATARVETDLGKIEDAIQAYQSAANLAPERIFPWNNLGNLNCMLERFEDARAAFQEAIEHNPKDPVSWNGMGDVYHKLGRIDDAIASYQLGNVFEEQGTEEDALKEFEASVDSDQENPLVWNEAGNIYFAAGAYEGAVAAYRRAIGLDPSNAAYRVSRAKAAQALEQADEESEPPAAQPLTETNPEVLPQPEPCFAETASPEPEKASEALPDFAWIEQEQEVETVPERLPNLPDAVAAPEPEAAYWMFKPVTPQGNTQQPAQSHAPAVVETVVETAKPIPAFTMQTRNVQSFQEKQVPVNSNQNHANVYVQMTPRTVQPPRTERKIIGPITNHDWGSSSPEMDSELCDTAPVPILRKTDPLIVQASPTGNLAALKPSPDRQFLEHDIAAYRRVTELNPKNDRAWDVLGNMYEKVGLHTEAIAAFELAIEICPQKEVYYYHLGIALGYQMHYDKAIEALERVVEINPDYVLAHCALAGYYRRLGKENEALEHMGIARPYMEAENEYNQACFESISGNADRAIELLGIALEKQQIQPTMVRSDPDLDFIRKDPRFEALLTKYGIINQ